MAPPASSKGGKAPAKVWPRLVSDMRTFLGGAPHASDQDLSKLLTLSNGSVEQAISMWFDSPLSKLGADVGVPPQVPPPPPPPPPLRWPTQAASNSHTAPQPPRLPVQHAGDVIDLCDGDDRLSPAPTNAQGASTLRVDASGLLRIFPAGASLPTVAKRAETRSPSEPDGTWPRLLGTFVCRAFATTRIFSGELQTGDEVVLVRGPHAAPSAAAKAGRGSAGRGVGSGARGGGGGSAARADTVIRVATLEPPRHAGGEPSRRDIGRVASESARFLAPLLDHGRLALPRAVISFCPPLPIGVSCGFELTVSAALTARAFSQSSAGRASMQADGGSRQLDEQMALVRLVAAAGLQPTVPCQEEADEEEEQQAGGSGEVRQSKAGGAAAEEEDEAGAGPELSEAEAEQLNAALASAPAACGPASSAASAAAAASLLPAPQPALLTTHLHRYQAQALTWLTTREAVGSEMPSLHPCWAEYAFPPDPSCAPASFYLNPSTGQASLSRPLGSAMPRGGILADEQGLGKTVELLALICADYALPSAGGHADGDASADAAANAAAALGDGDGAAAAARAARAQAEHGLRSGECAAHGAQQAAAPRPTPPRKRPRSDGGSGSGSQEEAAASAAHTARLRPIGRGLVGRSGGEGEEAHAHAHAYEMGAEGEAGAGPGGAAELLHAAPASGAAAAEQPQQGAQAESAEWTEDEEVAGGAEEVYEDEEDEEDEEEESPLESDGGSEEYAALTACGAQRGGEGAAAAAPLARSPAREQAAAEGSQRQQQRADGGSFGQRSPGLGRAGERVNGHAPALAHGRPQRQAATAATSRAAAFARAEASGEDEEEGEEAGGRWRAIRSARDCGDGSASASESDSDSEAEFQRPRSKQAQARPRQPRGSRHQQPLSAARDGDGDDNDGGGGGPSAAVAASARGRADGADAADADAPGASRKRPLGAQAEGGERGRPRPARSPPPPRSAACGSGVGSGSARLGRRVSTALGPTLVVVPTSLLSQWEAEVRAHTARGALRVLLHYGGERASSASEFGRAHIVLTTYGTVASEWQAQQQATQQTPQQPARKGGGASAAGAGPKAHGALFAKGFVWRRLILDEAHAIKGRQTLVSRACSALEAERRWAVTGTPMQNRLDDLFALLHFLRLPRFESYRWWSAHVLRPFSEEKDLRALRQLQQAVAPLLLRRTKATLGPDGQPIIRLPPRTVQTVQLPFSAAERSLYSELHEASKRRFDALVASGAVLSHYMDVLTLLLRLRQLCDHPLLLRARMGTDASAEQLARKLHRAAQAGDEGADDGGGEAGGEAQDSAAVRAAFVNRVLSSIGKGGAAGSAGGRDASQAHAPGDCPICLSPLEDGVITPCAHTFCRACILQTGGLHAAHAHCPVCRARVAKKALVTLPSATRFAGVDVAAAFEHSPKTRWLLDEIDDLLRLHRANGSSGNSGSTDGGGAEGTGCGGGEPAARGHAKAVVFSQWTAMLDVVQHALSLRKVRCVRLDGSMSVRKREEACAAFCSDPAVPIFLISLKAGGVGLNLVAANTVFLLDPWWNPAVEEQAIDRVHRIGQERHVTVKRCVMEDSVEGRILRLQEKKRCLQGALRLNLAQGEESRADKLDLDDLKLLFER